MANNTYKIGNSAQYVLLKIVKTSKQSIFKITLKS